MILSFLIGRNSSNQTALVKLVSLNAKSPRCYDYAFRGIDEQKCTLYAPKNSLDAYKRYSPWSWFDNIVGI